MKLILVMAQTADGKIAKNKSHAANWTSKEDKKHFIEITKKHKVIIMGASTYETIGKPLPGRLNLILTDAPEKYQKLQKPGKLEFFNGRPYQVINYLKDKGYTSAILGGGSYTNSAFLNSKLVDEIYFTFEGILFGKGLGVCDGLLKDVNLKIKKLKKLSDKTFLVNYEVVK